MDGLIPTVDPSSIQPMQQDPDMQAKLQAGQPTSMQPPEDNSLGAKLFPAPGVGDMLGPDALRQLRSLALMHAGLGILAASRGPRGTLNPGRALQEGLDPSAFQNSIQQAMQMRMMGMQFQGRQAVMKALQDDPDPATKTATGPASVAGDPMTQRAEWAARVAAKLATAGPYALEYANKYAEMAKTFRDAARKTSWQEVPGPGGTRAKQLYDDETGEPMGPPVPEPTMLSPEQAVSNRREGYGVFQKRIDPYEEAWRGYQNLTGITGTKKEDDVQRLVQLSKVLSPGHGIDLGQQIDPSMIAMIPGVGKYFAKLSGDGQILDKADRTELLNMAEKAAATNFKMSQNIINEETLRWPTQALGQPAFKNPWDDWNAARTQPRTPRGGRGGQPFKPGKVVPY